jgi:alpha-1,3-rhamnosyl/mannosyltransferase
MRIAYDVSPLSHPRTGVGNFVLGALRALVELGADVVAFGPLSPLRRHLVDEALEGLDIERWLPTLPPSHAWRTAWSRLQWPPAERVLGPFDVLHFSDWMYPPQRNGVRATTIHDLVPLRHPEWVTSRTRAMHTRKYRNTAATCDVVFVNSEFTGRDVTERLGVPAERVYVGHPAAKPAFRAEGDAADLGAPFLLTVATLEPRKNLQTLVDAHRLLGGELLLAVAGGEGWGDQPQLDGARIRRLGFVSDEELARLYRGAVAAVYPSRFEGFGIPVLEAMACGCPVVVSSHPSLDEASGDAAVRADPEDPAALAAAIENALGRRFELAGKGIEHASRFSWRAVGETFLRGYGEALAR